MNLWEIEMSCWEKGYHLVCGVDEAGAGPLAGPVYAAAVVLPPHLELKWLNDSKQVTPKRREILFHEIQSQAIAWAVTAVDETVIDEVNILNARLMAMERAICQLEPVAEYALIDGNRDKGITLSHEMVIKGDSKSASIAAASILAKVSRDHYMEEMARQYPQYQFDKHKGYPTKLHYELLDRFGPSPIHRKSFLKKWEERQ